MAVTWMEFVDAFRNCAGTGNTDQLRTLLTDDFNWPTSELNLQETLDWTANTSYRVTGEEVTLYENESVIAGTHDVYDDNGELNVVMGVGNLRGGKVYLYHHMRKVKAA